MEMSRAGRPATVALLILLAGCAGAGSGNRGSAGDHSRRFDVIESAELVRVRHLSALEAIRQLRPRWLHGRGPSIGVDGSTGQPTTERGEERVRAYVDGIARDLELLDMLETEDVASMRFLNASDATMRYGIGHTGGAILITTRHE